MKAIYYLIIAALLISTSCEMTGELLGKGGKTDPKDDLDPAIIGAVDLNLQLEVEVDTDETLSKSSTKVNIEDFSVQVIDSSGNVLYDFESYSAYSQAEILLEEGNYSFRSKWGVLREAAFDSPYYLSDTIIHVTPGELTTVSAICGLQNAKVNVSYTEDFMKVFKDDYAAVITNSLGVLTLDKNETRVAYFAAEENIRLEILATTRKGLDITTKHELVEVESNMLYDVKLGIDVSVESVVNNLAKPGITIDVTMHNRDTIINIAPPELPEEPGDGDDGPISIKGTLSVEMTGAEATAGTVPVKVTISAAAGLKAVHIKIVNATLEGILGDDNPFELINPSVTMKDLLDGVGLIRPTSGQTVYGLDVTGLMGLVGNLGIGITKFKVDVEDDAGNKATATLTVEIK